MRFVKAYWLVLLILLLAFALRAYRLDSVSLRGDESFTVLFVQKPLAQMWEETLTVEPNPPLLYFALRGWIALAGESEFATRFFSLWFGVLGAAFVFRLARDFFSPPPIGRGNFFSVVHGTQVGLAAAFLMALNPYQIWHAQDVRNYTMWPTFSVLALLLFWRWYRRAASSKRRAFWLALFVLAELLALYTHYYEAFLVLGLNGFVFVTRWREIKTLTQWIGAQVVLAVLYLPYPLLLSNRVSEYGEGSGRQGVALWDIARETFSAFVLSDTLDETLRVWVWIPFALLALGALLALARRDGKRALFFVMGLAAPTLCVFALNTFRPLYLERYLNGIAPLYYLLLAYGIVEIARAVETRLGFPQTRRVVATAALGVCALLAFFALQNYWTNPAYAKAPNWRGLTDIINANAQRGDIIVQNFPEMSLLYYDTSRLPLVVYPETFFPDAKTFQQLNAMNEKYQRVWFIPAAPNMWDHEEKVEQWLDRHNDLLNEWRVNEFRLRLYATPLHFLESMSKTRQRVENAMRLSGYRTERTNEALRVILYWRALGGARQNFEMQVEALDARGNVLHTQRGIPVQGDYPTDQWERNELIVDAYAFPNDAAIQALRVSACADEKCIGGELLPVQ